MANINLIVKDIKRSLDTFDLSQAIEQSDNEAKTRMYLVEPIFKFLRYDRGYEDGNLIPEYDADFANLKGKKVDYAIQFRNKPVIIIEVKKAKTNLSERHLSQLNDYFLNTNDSKIGILTNGIEYRFYCRNNNKGAGLHPTPFYSVNIENIEGGALDQLAEFYMTNIDVKSVIDKAQELFFLEEFEEAFYRELSSPSRDFIRAIYTQMNGSRLNEGTEKQIRELINSVSIKSALERLVVDEANQINSGIITTEKELEVYHVVKTILAQHKQIDTDSIGYKDYRGKFSVILDNSPRKKICDLYITPNSKKIEIEGEKFDIPDIDSIIKHKKKLTDRALTLLRVTC